MNFDNNKRNLNKNKCIKNLNTFDFSVKVTTNICYDHKQSAVSLTERNISDVMKELKKQASMLKLLGGEIYLQQYEEKKELGRGKFGVVFQVQDKNTKRIYAAKHIKTRKKEQREKVVEEIAILKKFSNPHIIRFT